MRVQRFVQVVLVAVLSFAATTSFQQALRAATGAPAGATNSMIERSEPAPRASAVCRPVRVVYPGFTAERCRPS